MNKKYIIIIVLILTNFTLQAQLGSFKDGYIVLTNNDTVYGQIRKKNDISLSFEVQFKSLKATDTAKIFSPFDLNSFGFLDDQINYKSLDFYNRINSKKIYSRRFAKQLISDYVSLYKINLAKEETNYTYETVLSYAYVLQIDTNYYSLTQEESAFKQVEFRSSYFNNQLFHRMPTYSILKKHYYGVIKYLFYDCPKISNAIRYVDFYDKDMIKIIEKYNQCKN